MAAYHDPQKSRCPDEHVLKDFALGKLPADAIESIGQHLTDCPRCEQTLVRIGNEHDSFVHFLQGRLDDDDEGDHQSSAELRRLKDRLRTLPKVLQSGTGSSADWSDPAAGVTYRKPVPQRLGQYRLLELVGHGGMGAVYKARHLKLKRNVAVKILIPRRLNDHRSVERFSREMETIGRLDEHPNIVRARDAGEIEGLHFLVMDFVDGVNASQLVARLGRLRAADACEIVRQTALGLEHAHRQGIIHRDVKPANIMLTQSGEVKLLDLGLAALERDTELGGSGIQIVGTADYIAPEQWAGADQADARADVYSLGCTLFKLLVGHAPYRDVAKRTADLMEAHRQAPVPSLSAIRPTLPAGLESAVTKMLAKRPTSRFASAQQVAEAMEPFTQQANLRELVGRTCHPVSDTHSQSIDVTMAMRSMIRNVRQRVRRKKVATSMLFIIIALSLAVTLGVIVGPRLGSPELNLLFAGQEETVLSFVDRATDTIRFQSQDETLVVLGSADSDTYTITTRIAKKPWQGSAGLYLGHHAQTFKEATNHYLEIVGLRTTENTQDGEIEIFRSETKISESEDDAIAWIEKPLATTKVTMGTGLYQELSVTVQEGVVTRVMLNDQRLDDLVLPSARNTNVGRGYGIYNFGGVTSFQATNVE